MIPFFEKSRKKLDFRQFGATLGQSGFSFELLWILDVMQNIKKSKYHFQVGIARILNPAR